MTEIRKRNHTTFGGIIYKGDFDHYNSMKDIANRIISDHNFDKQCIRNSMNRENAAQKKTII